MNHFRTGRVPCRANLQNGISSNHLLVIMASDRQCPLTKFEGGLNLLHKADDDTVIRLESTATATLAK